jgi:hypothetical protein
MKGKLPRDSVERKSKNPDNEIMMRKCLFGWFRLIYEAINLFISPAPATEKAKCGEKEKVCWK